MLRYIILSLAFIISFALPMYLGSYFISDKVDSNPEKITEKISLFKDQLSIPRDALSISSKIGGITNYNSDDDELALVWIKLRELPKKGTDQLFFSRSDANSSYQLRLRTDLSDQLRVDINISSENLKPQWYEFVPINIALKDWLLLLVTIKDKRFIALKYATYDTQENLRSELAGAYELAQEINLGSEFELSVGRLKGGLQAELGPVALFRGADFLDQIRAKLKVHALDPSVKFDFDGAEALFWLYQNKDYSNLKHSVTINQKE